MTKLNGKKAFCIITGASRGIGKTVSLEFCKLFHSESEVKLIARSENDLKNTSDAIQAINKNITTEFFAYDLSTPKMDFFQQLVTPKKKINFEIYVLVHNAGSEGISCLTKDMTDLEEWQRYMSMNFYSMTLLTSAFLDVNNVGNRLIINITSLAAIQPFKSLGYYCVGKAAREMYLRTLAEENKDIDVLNYSPGPVETDMIDRIIDNIKDKDWKNSFIEMKENKKLVKLEDTVRKLINVLDLSQYTSGGRVDYFD